MVSSEFESHLDNYGGDLRRWPAELRGDAEALLAASAEARAAKRAMELVEQVLAEAPEVGVSASMIAARAMRNSQIGRSTARTRPWARVAACGAATAAALALGIFVGDMHLDSHEDNADQILASALDQGNAIDVD